MNLIVIRCVLLVKGLKIYHPQKWKFLTGGTQDVDYVKYL